MYSIQGEGVCLICKREMYRDVYSLSDVEGASKNYMRTDVERLFGNTVHVSAIYYR